MDNMKQYCLTLFYYLEWHKQYRNSTQPHCRVVDGV